MDLVGIIILEQATAELLMKRCERINRFRLQKLDIEEYINTGVLLINLLFNE